MHVYSVLWTWLPRGELIDLIFLEVFRMEGLCLGECNTDGNGVAEWVDGAEVRTYGRLLLLGTDCISQGWQMI